MIQQRKAAERRAEAAEQRVAEMERSMMQRSVEGGYQAGFFGEGAEAGLGEGERARKRPASPKVSNPEAGKKARETSVPPPEAGTENPPAEGAGVGLPTARRG